jgi:hypothetical protein
VHVLLHADGVCDALPRRVAYEELSALRRERRGGV